MQTAGVERPASAQNYNEQEACGETMDVKTIITKIGNYKNRLADLNKAIISCNKHKEGFTVFDIYLHELEYGDTSLRAEIINALQNAKQVYEARINALENRIKTLDKIAKSFTDLDVDKA